MPSGNIKWRPSFPVAVLSGGPPPKVPSGRGLGICRSGVAVRILYAMWQHPQKSVVHVEVRFPGPSQTDLPEHSEYCGLNALV